MRNLLLKLVPRLLKNIINSKLLEIKVSSQAEITNMKTELLASIEERAQKGQAELMQVLASSFAGVDEKLRELQKDLMQQIRQTENIVMGILQYTSDRLIENDNINRSMLYSYSRDREYQLFNDITVEQVAAFISGQESSTIIGHWGQLVYNEIRDETKANIQVIDIGREPNITDLFAVQDNIEELLLLNSYLAAYVLKSSELLSAISERINSKFYFPARLSCKKIEVFWHAGFSSVEYEGNSCFRWASGVNKRATLEFWNSGSNHKPVTLSWESQVISGTPSYLYIAGFGVNKTVALAHTHSTTIRMDIQLPPGISRLDLAYIGQSFQPQGDPRYLNFTVKNFELSAGDGMSLSKDEVYKNEEHEYALNDYQIRDLLHSNGFFEVTAIAYARNGLVKYPLATTRYLHPGSVGFLTNNDKQLNDFVKEQIDSIIVIYTANRYGRLLEKGGRRE
jgi:hypothetical protein